MGVRPRFTNPATGETYDWKIGHAEESEAGKTRNITRSAPTGAAGNPSVGPVRQQGDDGPYILQYTGTILDRAQHQQMWRWYRMCASQTIYFRDFDSQQYEVQITDYKEQRHRTLKNRDPSAPQHYWTYTISMEVYRFIAGDMASAGVSP